MPRLIPTKAPNLLLAPTEYQRIYHEQMNNALRLYFARNDSNSSALLGPLGGKFVNSPHIAASDSTDQYADGNDDPTQVLFNTLEANEGFTLNLNGSATCPASGTYKIDYSLQFVNTDNLAHDVYVWLQTNGTVTPNSSSRFTIPARKSAGVPSFLVAYSSVTFDIRAGDSIRLWWATEKAYNPVGPVDGVYMEHIPAQTLPYPRPANPSAVGSIVLVSGSLDTTA